MYLYSQLAYIFTNIQVYLYIHEHTNVSIYSRTYKCINIFTNTQMYLYSQLAALPGPLHSFAADDSTYTNPEVLAICVYICI